jgi:fructose-1,6-bisphosphatase/inositol monophosphatase family enzyme
LSLTAVERRGLSQNPPKLGPETFDDADPSAWIELGLATLWDAGILIRTARMSRMAAHLKGDGSPATAIERQIEVRLRARVARCCPEAAVVGEETAGEQSRTGVTVAIDPVDGTWAFLGRTETSGTAIVFLRAGQPFLGMVSNPNTGEIAYAVAGDTTRLIQLPVFGEGAHACDLPLDSAKSSAVLVNVHPNRRLGDTSGVLFEAWSHSQINMVRMPGGSPSVALLEAAKGGFIYANHWGAAPPDPWDLAPGVLLVRGAGGDVIGLDGSPIDPMTHAGPFVAGVSEASRRKVAKLVTGALVDPR